MRLFLYAAATVAALTPGLSRADDAQAGQICAQLATAAAGAVNDRVQANNAYVKQPESVSGLSCLGSFFSGTGLNLITNIPNPAALVENVIGQVEGQICQAAQGAWQRTVGSVQQCGLSLNGVNMGLNIPQAGGFMCPSLHFGGNGASLGSLGASGTTPNPYNQTQPLLPTGYPQQTLSLGTL